MFLFLERGPAVDKFFEWLSARFQQPLSLLFFALGTLLIFFGLSTGFQIKGETVSPDARYHWLALAFGAASCGLAIVIYYLPTTRTIVRQGEDEGGTSYFSKLLDERNVVTSESQKRILNLFATLPGEINQIEVTKMIREKIDTLRNVPGSEIYYRLEQLHWMGFLAKRESGKEYMYGMSNGYRRYLDGR